MATLNVVLWDLTLVDLLLFGEEVNRELLLVRVTGVEPAHLAAQDPKSCVSANSTIPAYLICFYDYIIFYGNFKRWYGLLFLFGLKSL